MRNTTLKYTFRLFLLSLLFMLIFCAAASAAGIKGTVWIDQNNDGLYGKGEDILKNVPVYLESAASSGEFSVCGETKTDKEGAYQFTSVGAGLYRIRVQLPSEYRFAKPGLDSAALPACGSESWTAPFQMNDQSTELLIGATRSSSSITFVAFEDLNANGGRMNSEPLIRDVSIEIYYPLDGKMHFVASAVTNKNGEAKIGTLSPTDYVISVTLPDGYTFGPLGKKINQWYNCMPPSDGIYGVSDPVEVPAKTNMGFGIGMVKTGVITGSVWFDGNAAGRYKADSPLSGLTIDLTNKDSGLTRTVSSSADGSYEFKNLPAGNYAMSVSLPEAYMFTYGDSLFSDPQLRTGTLPSIVLEAGEVIQMDPIGIMQDTAVSVRVYVDSNCNAMYDTDEPLYEGVKLTLQAERGIFDNVTDADGSCVFHGLTGKTALLQCELTDGYIFTKDGGDSLFTYTSGSSSASGNVSIGLGATTDVLIGITRPSSVSGILYEDIEMKGSFVSSSVLLTDYEVQLIGENGAHIAETRTDMNGSYSFGNLPGGLYKVRFLYQDPYIASTSRAAAGSSRPNQITSQNMDYGETDPFMLNAAETRVVDAALYQAGSIDGYVLLNSAYDHLQTNDGGLEGVKVTLLTKDGTVFAEYLTDETNADGHYYIKGIPGGTYIVCLNTPDLSVFVHPIMGSRQWTSDPITVENGKNHTVDSVGAVRTSVFSGIVSIDPDSVTPGSVQSTVELRSQKFGTLLTRRTDGQGFFEFRGLLPGAYDLTVTTSEGYLFTGSSDDFIPVSPTNKTQCELMIEMGSDWQNRSVTVSLPASLSLRLYYDQNNSGTNDAEDSAVPEMSFTITGPNTEKEAVTDENGLFSAADLYPGEYTFTFTLDADTILPDGNEKQANTWSVSVRLSDNERLSRDIPVLVLGSMSGAVWNLDGASSHIDHLSIHLYKDSSLIAETETDTNGQYRFDRLYPGTYSLEMDIPETFVFARKRDTESRSSMILDTGSEAVPLLMGENVENCDIGIGAIGAIGDFVWLDENKNGLQDIGESGVPGIHIVLCQYGDEIADTTTDPYGLYELKNLYPGVYTMLVTLPEETASTRQRSDFPLVSSILPENKDGAIEFEITVPSGETDLNLDMGLVLKTDGVYPANMNDVPTKDWTPYTDRRR